MIQIHDVDGLCCPIIICDHCHGQCDVEESLAVWDSREKPAAVRHVHKGDCDRAIDPRRRLRSDSLRSHLRALRWNAKDFDDRPAHEEAAA